MTISMENNILALSADQETINWINLIFPHKHWIRATGATFTSVIHDDITGKRDVISITSTILRITDETLVHTKLTNNIDLNELFFTPCGDYAFDDNARLAWERSIWKVLCPLIITQFDGDIIYLLGISGRVAYAGNNTITTEWKIRAAFENLPKC